MTRFQFLLAALALLMCFRTSAGQGKPAAMDADVAARIDAMFAEHAKAVGPGFAVGVCMNGEPLYMKGHGLANLESILPITPDTAFNLGSISKQFTAMALLLLEQRGKVALDDDVRKYVPELPDYGIPIRVVDLLYHTSGLRDFGTLETLAGTHLQTMEDFLALLSSQRGLNFAPGTRHEYTHSDYEMLGLVVQRIVGTPLGDFLDREIFKPLGMTSTRLNDDRRLLIPGRAFAHKTTEGGYRVVFPNEGLIGGSNVYSSVADLVRWERNFYTAQVGGREIIDRMLSRPKTSTGLFIPYAFGLRHDEYRGLPIVHRGGGGGGFGTEMTRFPKQGLAVFVLSNLSPSHPAHLSRAVAEALLGEQMLDANSGAHKAFVAVPQEELQRYSGIYQPLDVPWDMIHVIARDGKLYEVYGGKDYELLRHEYGRYSIDEMTFAFTPATEESPVRLRFSYKDVVQECVRRSDSDGWTPSADALADYAGLFYSEDLGVVWELRVQKGALVLHRVREVGVSLTPIDPDLFSSDIGDLHRPFVLGIRFERSAEGRITGFTLSALPDPFEVARDIRFERVQRD